MEDDPLLKNSYLKRTAFMSYFDLVNQMYSYENSLFELYRSKATYKVNAVMRKNILRVTISNKSSSKTREYKRRDSERPVN